MVDTAVSETAARKKSVPVREPGLRYHAEVAKLAEATVLETVICGFESHLRHYVCEK